MEQNYYIGVFSVEDRCFCLRVLATTIEEADCLLGGNVMAGAVLISLFEMDKCYEVLVSD